MLGRLFIVTVVYILTDLVQGSPVSSPALVLSPSRPVELRLQISSNETGVIKLPQRSECRTNALFFEETLGIERGQPLSFDIDRWRAIQRCGLFKNLTAKAFANDKGEVTLHVLGEELPSIHFSPEVSVAASLDKPEASGGVVFSDRNFRGLGQRFDFQVAKKEGKESGTDALKPTISVKWTDNVIGKTTIISAGFDDESTLQDSADMVPTSQLEPRVQIGTKTQFHRIQINVKRAFVKFRDLDFLNFARNHGRKNRPPEGLGCVLELDLEPYIEASTIINGDAVLQGAKVSAVAKWRQGMTATLTHDGGIGSYAWGCAPFHQMTAEVTSPVMNVLGQFGGRLALPSQLGGDWVRDAMQLTCKLRAKVMNSWGQACLPLVHSVSLGDSQLVRSYTDQPNGQLTQFMGVHRKRATALAAFKTDMYLNGLGSIKPGWFADLAVFRAPAVTRSSPRGKVTVVQMLERAAGVGLSMRGFGFRMDVAWPVNTRLLSSTPTATSVPAPTTLAGGILGQLWGQGKDQGRSKDRARQGTGSSSSAPRLHLGIDLGD